MKSWWVLCCELSKSCSLKAIPKRSDTTGQSLSEVCGISCSLKETEKKRTNRLKQQVLSAKLLDNIDWLLVVQFCRIWMVGMLGSCSAFRKSQGSCKKSSYWHKSKKGNSRSFWNISAEKHIKPNDCILGDGGHLFGRKIFFNDFICSFLENSKVVML